MMPNWPVYNLITDITRRALSCNILVFLMQQIRNESKSHPYPTTVSNKMEH